MRTKKYPQVADVTLTNVYDQLLHIKRYQDVTYFNDLPKASAQIFTRMCELSNDSPQSARWRLSDGIYGTLYYDTATKNIRLYVTHKQNHRLEVLSIF